MSAEFFQPIKVEGLVQFQRAIKQVDSDLPKVLRMTLNDAVGLVVDDAKPRVPTRTGAAQRSVKAQSTQNRARVAAGGRRAPYFPWLDFGGKRKGRGDGIAARPFKKTGRYVWHSFAKKRPEILERLESGIAEVARQAGLEVSNG